MVSLGDIIVINLKDWLKKFVVAKTFSTIIRHGWTRLVKFFLIWTAEINPELCFTLKIPEFNWGIQNYSSLDHNVNEIG